MRSAVGQGPAALLLVAFELALLAAQMRDALLALDHLDFRGPGFAAESLPGLFQLARAMGTFLDGGLELGHLMLDRGESLARFGQRPRGSIVIGVGRRAFGFGGRVLRTAYATLSMGGTLVSFEWPRPGLPLYYLNR